MQFKVSKYTVNIGRKPTCECNGYLYDGKNCVHILAAKEYLSTNVGTFLELPMVENMTVEPLPLMVQNNLEGPTHKPYDMVDNYVEKPIVDEDVAWDQEIENHIRSANQTLKDMTTKINRLQQSFPAPRRKEERQFARKRKRGRSQKEKRLPLPPTPEISKAKISGRGKVVRRKQEGVVNQCNVNSLKKPSQYRELQRLVQEAQDAAVAGRKTGSRISKKRMVLDL